MDGLIPTHLITQLRLELNTLTSHDHCQSSTQSLARYGVFFSCSVFLAFVLLRDCAADADGGWESS